jgi:threonine dehydrogenase-like Zn-dependent dehydrogenase
LKEKMRAVIFPKPNEINIVSDAEVRGPGPGEALVRIKSSTLCATDSKILAGKFPGTKFPHIPGHEWSGEVVEVGPGVSELKAGDRVGEEPHVGCGRCPRCLEGLYQLCFNYGKIETGHQHIGFTINGGLAEYCTCSVRALHKLPPSLSYDEGAFTESVGVALYAIERVGINPGDKVAIFGPGAIGLIGVQIARYAKGASKIVLLGTRDDRLELGKKLGADEVINVRKMSDEEKILKGAKDLLGPDSATIGFDMVAEFAGSEDASREAIRLARRGGRVVLAGSTSPGTNLNVDLSAIIRGQLDIHGSLADPMGICARGIDLIARKLVNVKPLMSGDYKLEDFEKALDDFQNRVDGAYRVMIHP